MQHGSGWGPPPGTPPGGWQGGNAPPPPPGPAGPSGWGPPPPGHGPPAPYNPPPPPGGQQDSLHVAAMTVGILSIIGMLVGFVPCLGWLNWMNIPFGMIALVLGIVGVSRHGDPNKTGSIVGIVCGSIAMLLGFIRLVLGGGML